MESAWPIFLFPLLFCTLLPSMDTPAVSLPKVYSPKEYWFLVFFLGPLPAYLMYRHNSRILQLSAEKRRRMQIPLIVWLLGLFLIESQLLWLVLDIGVIWFINEYGNLVEIPAIQQARTEGRIHADNLSPAKPALIGLGVTALLIVLLVLSVRWWGGN